MPLLPRRLVHAGLTRRRVCSLGLHLLPSLLSGQLLRLQTGIDMTDLNFCRLLRKYLVSPRIIAQKLRKSRLKYLSSAPETDRQFLGWPEEQPSPAGWAARRREVWACARLYAIASSRGHGVGGSSQDQDI